MNEDGGKKRERASSGVASHGTHLKVWFISCSSKQLTGRVSVFWGVTVGTVECRGNMMGGSTTWWDMSPRVDCVVRVGLGYDGSGW